MPGGADASVDAVIETESRRFGEAAGGQRETKGRRWANRVGEISKKVFLFSERSRRVLAERMAERMAKRMAERMAKRMAERMGKERRRVGDGQTVGEQIRSVGEDFLRDLKKIFLFSESGEAFWRRVGRWANLLEGSAMP